MKYKNRILIIGPQAFDILLELRDYLESVGWHVDLVDDRFSQSFFKIFVLRYFRRIYFKIFSSSVFSNFKTSWDTYDKILIVNGEALSLRCHLQLMSSLADVYFYTWDSVKNKPYLLDIFNLYKDNAIVPYSFDVKDSTDFKISYQPLFSSITTVRCHDTKYLASFVGTMHSQRLKFAKLCLSHFGGNEKNFIRLFCKNRFIYTFYFCRNLFSIFDFLRIVRVGSISKDEFAAIQYSSRFVLDFCHPNQTGLTHRSVVALRNGLQLVTNNSYLPDALPTSVNGIQMYTSRGIPDTSFDISCWAKNVLNIQPHPSVED